MKYLCKKSTLLLCFMFSASAVLSSCQMWSKIWGNPYPSSNSMPNLPHKVAGTSDETAMKLQARLNQGGVQVVTLGQDYLVKIPTLLLFPDGSPQLTWKSYALLNDVVCYLKQFRKISVSVNAYSSRCDSVARERALTLARAREVANYLWSQGIESRFVFSQGLANDRPMVAGALNNDRSPNSRIEITFRDAVA